jgi:hypothetical protein
MSNGAADVCAYNSHEYADNQTFGRANGGAHIGADGTYRTAHHGSYRRAYWTALGRTHGKAVIATHWGAVDTAHRTAHGPAFWATDQRTLERALERAVKHAHERAFDHPFVHALDGAHLRANTSACLQRTKFLRRLSETHVLAHVKPDTRHGRCLHLPLVHSLH